jgi:hypothetical protein
VLHDDGDGIRLGVEREEQFMVFELRHRALGQALVPAHLAVGFVEIVGSDVSHKAPAFINLMQDLPVG